MLVINISYVSYWGQATVISYWLPIKLNQTTVITFIFKSVRNTSMSAVVVPETLTSTMSWVLGFYSNNKK